MGAVELVIGTVELLGVHSLLVVRGELIPRCL